MKSYGRWSRKIAIYVSWALKTFERWFCIRNSARRSVGILSDRVQTSRPWLGTSPGFIDLLEDRKDRMFNEHTCGISVIDHVLNSARNKFWHLMQRVEQCFKLIGQRDIFNLPNFGTVTAREDIEAVLHVCPVELKSKALTYTVSQLYEKGLEYGDPKRFFTLKRDKDLTTWSGIPLIHIHQFAHYDMVFSSTHCLYIVWTVW